MRPISLGRGYTLCVMQLIMFNRADTWEQCIREMRLGLCSGFLSDETRERRLHFFHSLPCPRANSRQSIATYASTPRTFGVRVATMFTFARMHINSRHTQKQIQTAITTPSPSPPTQTAPSRNSTSHKPTHRPLVLLSSYLPHQLHTPPARHNVHTLHATLQMRPLPNIVSLPAL